MKRLEIIILLIIAIGLILNVFKTTSVSVEGYSQEEVNYILEIQSLKEQNNNLKYAIKNRNHEFKKDSSDIVGSNVNELDSTIRSLIRR